MQKQKINSSEESLRRKIEKEEIDEKLKIINRTENHNLIEMAKKIELLSLP